MLIFNFLHLAGLVKEARENAHLGVEWGGRRWCITSGKSLSSHALLLTAHSTQAVSRVGGNGNSSNGKHLLTPRTDCAHSADTCRSQIKTCWSNTAIAEPRAMWFRKHVLSESSHCPTSKKLCILLTLLSGGAGMAKGTCQTEVLLGFKGPWMEELILLSTWKGFPGSCPLPKAFFLLTLTPGFCPGVRRAHTFTLRGFLEILQLLESTLSA